jgi:hypothetical protein
VRRRDRLGSAHPEPDYGPRAYVREAELLQEFSDIALVELDAEFLGDDALEVDPTPADDAVLFTIRAGLDDLRELSLLLCRQARLGPSVQLSTRPSGPEALKRWTPSRKGLPVHAADLRR